MALSQARAQVITKIDLEAYKRIDNPARNEVSGIVKSRAYENTFWVHGDSGTPDRIYAINEDGEIISNDEDYRGAKVKGAKNLDWEDIAIGENGTLILADIGNNCECRDDLKIFILEEPNPKDDEVEVLREYEVSYPEREDWFGRLMRSNYNSEAIFQVDGVIYILTKQPRKTILFKLKEPKEDEINQLEMIESFSTNQYVTAADVSSDGSLVAILTYDQVMVFNFNPEGFLNTSYRTAFLEGGEQIESIGFNGNDLIIAEENGHLYRIGLDDLIQVTND
jgi:hypothetical protein